MIELKKRNILTATEKSDDLTEQKLFITAQNNVQKYLNALAKRIEKALGRQQRRTLTISRNVGEK